VVVNSNRFTAPIKSRNGKNTTSVILSAGVGYRMKSYGPKCLLKTDSGKTILEQQIAAINFCLPKSDIIVVLGFECDKAMKVLDNKSRVVENQCYEETNTAESLRLALNNGVRDSVLIMHGDLSFNKETLLYCDFRKSFAIIDSQDQFKSGEVGVTINNKKATRFGYGLETKWAQIAFFRGRELSLLKNICRNRERQKMYTFEILNEILDSGGDIATIEPENMVIRDIDSSRDLL